MDLLQRKLDLARDTHAVDGAPDSSLHAAWFWTPKTQKNEHLQLPPTLRMVSSHEAWT